MDVTDTNGFHEWLKEKERTKQVRPRVHLELPNPSDYPVKSKREEPENDNRGVCVIDLY